MPNYPSPKPAWLVLKPWPNRLVNQCNVWAVFCLATHLWWLELTLVRLKSVRKFFYRLAPNAIQHKLITSQLYARGIYDFFVTCVNLWADLRIRLATHRKSVCNCSGFANLRQFASTCESAQPGLNFKAVVSRHILEPATSVFLAFTGTLLTCFLC